eukprot:tig00020723_g13513.t1
MAIAFPGLSQELQLVKPVPSPEPGAPFRPGVHRYASRAEAERAGLTECLVCQDLAIESYYSAALDRAAAVPVREPTFGDAVGRYVTGGIGKKHHAPSCEHLLEVGEYRRGLRRFESAADAREAGFEECLVCRPDCYRAPTASAPLGPSIASSLAVSAFPGEILAHAPPSTVCPCSNHCRMVRLQAAPGFYTAAVDGQ